MVEKLEIGQIVNTFGIKGFVKVKPFTDDIRRFDNLQKVYVESKKVISEVNSLKNPQSLLPKSNTKEQVRVIKEYEIEEVKYHKEMVLIKFKGIEKVEEADLLRESYLKLNREDVEALPKDTHYIVDLIGLVVYTDRNEKLGTLEDIFNTGSSDIYVVKDEFGKQYLLPAISDVVKEIDMKNKKIIVHLLQGLI